MTNRYIYTPDLSAFKRLAEEGYNLIPVYREISADLETPVSAFIKVARGAKSFLFESVEGGENLARYSFLGTEPSSVIRTGAGTAHGNVDPLNVLKEHLDPIRYPAVQGLPKFDGGAVGYVAYDAIKYFEPRVPEISSEELGMGIPEAVFMLTDSLLIFDHVRHSIVVVAHAAVGTGTDPEVAYSEAQQRIESLIERLSEPLPASAMRRAGAPTHASARADDADIDYSFVGSAHSMPAGWYTYDTDEAIGHRYVPNMSRANYRKMVEACKQAIYDGELIQVVVSQRLTRRTAVEPFDLYRSLRAINPSPYMFYLDLDGFQIIGASPELLVQSVDGKVAVHPIAGSRPRGLTPEEDEALAEELLANEKEIAEHVMLLDLGRNDVGRISRPGTVRVMQQFEIERYSHIMHIVSHVEGMLDDGYDVYDVLRAGFPAGTVSGAPKIRAMEIIAEYEPDKRGAYSGAVGYFSYSGNMDTAISLRTMTLRDGVAYLQAGGGIVADSDPQFEYEETLHKMGALMHAIDHAESLQAPSQRTEV